MILMGLLLNRTQRLPYYQYLSRKYGLRLLVFSPADINWSRRSTTGLLLQRGAWYWGTYPLPAAIYNRCYPGEARLIARLEEVLGSGRIFNTATAFDKLQVHQILQKSGVLQRYLPPAQALGSESLEKLLCEGKKLVIKPRIGQSGRGVYLLEPAGGSVVVSSAYGITLPLPTEAFSAFLAVLAAEAGYIVQEYVEGAVVHGGLFDVRLVAQKGRQGEWEITGALSRAAQPDTFVTNYYRALYAPAHLLRPLGEMGRRALSTMAELALISAGQLDGGLGHLGEICVDFMVDPQGKPWIIEVNGKPDKSLFHELGDEEMRERVYLTPLTYLKRLSYLQPHRAKGVEHREGNI